MKARSTSSNPSTPLPSPRILERFELADLSVVVRDDQLAGLTVRHVVAGAERVHQPSPFDAQPGFQDPVGSRCPRE
jgi:hypothetical protein